jgi:hypothetical protein
VNRRSVIGVFAALLFVPEPIRRAANLTKIPRLGILSPAASPSTKAFDAFRAGLPDLGRIDGQNVTIEYRLFAGYDCRSGRTTGRRNRRRRDEHRENCARRDHVDPYRRRSGGLRCG